MRWAPHVTRGPVLDVACGDGRHSKWFRELGFEVVAVDREPVVLEKVTFIEANLEDGSPWPLGKQRFGGIVVTNYLYRPLFPLLVSSLAEGGVLIYETFMRGNECFGKPSNPDFLLRPGELREVFDGLQELGFEEGEFDQPKRAMIQRICVLKR
jgi:SAM-dependent methyltransferase